MQSSARLTTIESRILARDTMPPLHARDEEETYRVVDGEVLFWVGDETVHARAGEVVLAPHGVPRTWQVVSETASWILETALRCPARYEDWTRAVACPGGDTSWPSPEEEASVRALARSNGISVLGPPGSLPMAPLVSR